MLDVVNLGVSLRQTHETRMNATSSRSASPKPQRAPFRSPEMPLGSRRTLLQRQLSTSARERPWRGFRSHTVFTINIVQKDRRLADAEVRMAAPALQSALRQPAVPLATAGQPAGQPFYRFVILSAFSRPKRDRHLDFGVHEQTDLVEL